MVMMKTRIGELELKNPVMVASGTFGYGEEFSELYDISKLGAVVTKGISLEPRQGNPMPRVVEVSSGLINSIGLENVGLDAFITDKLSFLRERGATVIVNVFGESIKEYADIACRLENEDGIHAIELNVSCPNVQEGGIQFGAATETVSKLTKAVRRSTTLPIIVKLSPMVTDIAAVAQAAEKGGADAVSLINTVPAMAIDALTRRPKVANVVGGLSGPAIKPVALRQVWQVYNAVKIPVIGMGGIMNVTDAVEFFIAGSAAVQIGTANFVRPTVAVDIIDGLERYCDENNMPSVADLVGTLQT